MTDHYEYMEFPYTLKREKGPSQLRGSYTEPPSRGDSHNRPSTLEKHHRTRMAVNTCLRYGQTVSL